MFSDHIKQDMFLAFQTGGCLLVHKTSADMHELSALPSLSNYLSIAISMSPEWMVALNRFNRTMYSYVTAACLVGEMSCSWFQILSVQTF